MPRLGLGTYKADEGPDVEGAVAYGLSIGYRLIDTAAVYGNEAGVGRAVRESTVPRDDVFVTTKLWNADQGYESALKAFDVSLGKLGLDYVDLYLVHWPWSERMRDTWRAMEQLLVTGRTRAIGVCNFLPHHLDELAEFATTMPAVNQCELHPRLQQPELQAACASPRHHPAGVGADHARPREPHPRAGRDREPPREDARAGLDSLDPPEGHRHDPQVHPRRPASPRTATSTTSSSPPRRWRSSTRSTPGSASGRIPRPTPQSSAVAGPSSRDAAITGCHAEYVWYYALDCQPRYARPKGGTYR